MGLFGSNQGNQARYSGELHNLQLTQSVFGTTAPIIIGTRRVAAKLLFYGGFKATKVKQGGGKGLGGGKNGGDQYEYFADVQMALASGSAAGGCRGILNVWDQQGRLANQSGSFNFTIPFGGGAIAPGAGGPPIQMDLGVSVSVPYSVTVNDYASGGVQTLSGNQDVDMDLVSGTPAAGQYAFDAPTSTYTFAAADAGKVVTIRYSAVFSLYYFIATQAAEVPGSPYQVSTDNQTYFYADRGVTRVDTGAALVHGTDYTESAGVYTFSASLAGVYVYINYEFTSSDANITNSSKLNLTFFGGTLGQAVNSYWTSKYASAAFGYTGICHADANPMALGMSAVLPSYNYEVVGLCVTKGGRLDAHPCDGLNLLLTDAFLGVGFPQANIGDWTSAIAYWAANGYFVSVIADTQTSVADAFSKVVEVGNVGAVWSEGLLKLVPYGDTTQVGNGYTYHPNTTPAATLTWDDMLPESEEAPGGFTKDDLIQWARVDPADCWNYVQAQYCNRLNDYNNELINEQNDAFIHDYGRRVETPQTWDWISSKSAATWALRLRLNRQCYMPNTCKFWLPMRFASLEAMDMVVLPTGEAVRITWKDEDPDGRMAMAAEQWRYGSGNVTVYPKQDPVSYVPEWSLANPGDTFPVIFEASPQSVLARPNTIQIALAGNDPDWGGCDIYVSSDNSSYTHADRVKSLNRTGLLASVLPNTADPDNTSTLTVDMSNSGGELVSVTAAQKDAFVSLAAIVDPGGTVELVSYETATLFAADRYHLTALRRGVYGTTVALHGVGALFSYLGTGGVYEYQYPAQFALQTVYFKFASFNLAGRQSQDLANCKAYAFTVPGYTLQPPSSGAFSTDPAQPLTSQASGSTAQITVANVTAKLNNQAVAWTFAAPITGLNQNEAYFVYVIDLAFRAGAKTPIATQNSNDFVGRVGYYQLTGPNPDGSVTTGNTGGTWYRPNAYIDSGQNSVARPQSAYDTSPSSSADVNAYGVSFTGLSYQAAIEYYTLPNVTPTGATLYVTASVANGAASGQTVSAWIDVSFDGGATSSNLLTASLTTATATYTMAVPAGTNLNQVQVKCGASATVPSSGSGGITLSIFDINVH